MWVEIIKVETRMLVIKDQLWWLDWEMLLMYFDHIHPHYPFLSTSPLLPKESLSNAAFF
jgi:hypothetical protein